MSIVSSKKERGKILSRLKSKELSIALRHWLSIVLFSTESAEYYSPGQSDEGTPPWVIKASFLIRP